MKEEQWCEDMAARGQKTKGEDEGPRRQRVKKCRKRKREPMFWCPSGWNEFSSVKDLKKCLSCILLTALPSKCNTWNGKVGVVNVQNKMNLRYLTHPHLSDATAKALLMALVTVLSSPCSHLRREVRNAGERPCNWGEKPRNVDGNVCNGRKA